MLSVELSTPLASKVRHQVRLILHANNLTIISDINFEISSVKKVEDYPVFPIFACVDCLAFSTLQSSFRALHHRYSGSLVIGCPPSKIDLLQRNYNYGTVNGFRDRQIQS